MAASKSAVTLGEVTALAVAAAGLADAVDLFRKLAEAAKPGGLGGCEPTQETFLTWARTPDARFRVQHATHIANYLDGLRAVINADAHTRARLLCYAVLQDERKRRFAGLDTHLAEAGRIQQYSGNYVLVRQDTKKGYLYELLFLEDTGASPTGAFATLVQQDAVYRGTWRVARKALHCHLTGYLVDCTHDIVDLFLSLEHIPQESYGGFLAGLTSADGFPVVMPVLAVRVEDMHESIARLKDIGDRAACKLLAGADPGVGGLSVMVQGAFDILPVTEIRPSSIAIRYRMALNDHREVISARFQEFLTEGFTDQALGGLPDNAQE